MVTDAVTVARGPVTSIYGNFQGFLQPCWAGWPPEPFLTQHPRGISVHRRWRNRESFKITSFCLLSNLTAYACCEYNAKESQHERGWLRVLRVKHATKVSEWMNEKLMKAPAFLNIAKRKWKRAIFTLAEGIKESHLCTTDLVFRKIIQFLKHLVEPTNSTRTLGWLESTVVLTRMGSTII